ncbi:SH3 domain-containing protein [Streptomyces sp. NPDC092307]|uniref:SH3 domain-containing protein n=1 Tax=Streptomyces sp. NPDC092307 TaxID=3366013 RepID=UPI00381C7B06
MPTAPSEPYGTVVTGSGVNIRQFPSTDSTRIGALESGAKVGIRGKVRAQNIDGNDIWYLLRGREGWVSARYVTNTGNVKWCKDLIIKTVSADE